MNPNDCAFPWSTAWSSATGMSKREYIATHIMAGLLAAQIHGFNNDPSKQGWAEMSVRAADALLAELNKP